MANESEVMMELLARWEEQRRQGRKATAEELCPHDGHLRHQLQQRIALREVLHSAFDLSDTGPQAAGPTEKSEPNIAGFTIEEAIGRDGMGVVYRAVQQSLRRTVALKVILAGANADERARFRTEAEAVARLQHPNIVQIHRVGEQAGSPYLALEFVAGVQGLERRWSVGENRRGSTFLYLQRLQRDVRGNEFDPEIDKAPAEQA
jgi:serine/threonine protein kinase